MIRSAGRRKVASGIFADLTKYTLTFGAVGSYISKDDNVGTFLGILLISAASFLLALWFYPKEKEIS